MRFNFRDIIRNKRVMKIGITLVVLIFLFLIILLIHKIKEDKWNNQDISNAKHGIIIEENISFYRKAKESKWRLIKETEVGDNAYIIEEIEDKKSERWYKVKIDDKVGYVKKSAIKTFEFDDINTKTLMSDVSKFNVIYKHFEKPEDYETFIIKSNINYAYIRLGGRGYGEEGNFYTDPNFDIFIKACDYLGVPYGFYFIDEALNTEEVIEEVEFIKDLVDKNKTKMCKLPLMIDIETFDGEGRADDLNEERAVIAEELTQRFKEENLDTIIYANAKYASEFLYMVNSKFWLAYYDEQDKIPEIWYTETDQEAALNEELMNKLIAWQFTDRGAGDQIPYNVDVSIVDNMYFKTFVDNAEEK